MSISSRTLFKKDGISIDRWEVSLKEEGLLFEKEDLLEVLKQESNLYRGILSEMWEGAGEDTSLGDMPRDWTEEDYLYYQKKGGRL